MLRDRIGQRGNDASDADATILRQQRAQDPGDISWNRLDAPLDVASVLSSTIGRVRDRGTDLTNDVASEIG